MESSDLFVLFAGLLAYGVAIVLGAGPLVYFAFLVDTALTGQVNEEGEINKGNVPIAIEVGTIILCQAILVRHGVYAAMAIIRSLFVDDLSRRESFRVLWGSILSAAIIIALALISVHVAGFVFKWFAKLKFSRKAVMNIDEGIRERRNTAMAVFYALVLLAMTVVLNEGMEDFSRSLIPYGRGGLIEVL